MGSSSTRKVKRSRGVKPLPRSRWVWGLLLLVLLGSVGGALKVYHQRLPRGMLSRLLGDRDSRSLDLVFNASVERGQSDRDRRGSRSLAGIDLDTESRWLSEQEVNGLKKANANSTNSSQLRRVQRRKRKLSYLRAAANLTHRDSQLASAVLEEMTHEVPSDRDSLPSEKAEDLQTLMWSYLASSDGSQDLVESVAPSILSQGDSAHQQMMFCEFSRFYPEEKESLAANLRSKGVSVGGCNDRDDASEGGAQSSSEAILMDQRDKGTAESAENEEQGQCPPTDDLAELRCLSDPKSSPIISTILSLKESEPNSRPRTPNGSSAQGGGANALGSQPVVLPSPAPSGSPSPSPSSSAPRLTCYTRTTGGLTPGSSYSCPVWPGGMGTCSTDFQYRFDYAQFQRNPAGSEIWYTDSSCSQVLATAFATATSYAISGIIPGNVGGSSCQLTTGCTCFNDRGNYKTIPAAPSWTWMECLYSYTAQDSK